MFVYNEFLLTTIYFLWQLNNTDIFFTLKQIIPESAFEGQI